MSLSRFERTLGLSIPNRNLRLALCRHKSILPASASHAKYGYAQDTLAIFGDRLVNTAAQKACKKGLFEHLPKDKVNSNEYMYHYVWDSGLARFLQIDSNRDLKPKTLYHAYGTYFEAIVAAIYYCHGYNVLDKFLEDYFVDLTLYTYLSRRRKKVAKHQAYRNLEYAQAVLNTPGTAYRLLKSVVEDHFGESLEVVSLNYTVEEKAHVRLDFELPDLSGGVTQNFSFNGKGITYKQALEAGAKRALRKIEALYVNYARAIEASATRTRAEDQIQQLRVLTKP